MDGLQTPHSLSHLMFTVMRSGLIIVGVVLAAFALSEARSPPGPQACTADWDPVCGVDNKTYGNACMARAKGVKIAKKGECKVCACPKNIDPVCGVNKVTYDNKCLAKCEVRQRCNKTLPTCDCNRQGNY